MPDLPLSQREQDARTLRGALLLVAKVEVYRQALAALGRLLAGYPDETPRPDAPSMGVREVAEVYAAAAGQSASRPATAEELAQVCEAVSSLAYSKGWHDIEEAMDELCGALRGRAPHPGGPRHE